MTQVLGIGCGLLVIGLLVADLVRTPGGRVNGPAFSDATADRVITVRNHGDPEQFTFGPTWPDATMICVEDGACLTLGVLRRQELASR